MTKGSMGNFRCKEKCVHLEGYEEGYFHYQMEKKGWCQSCNYKIRTDNIRCPCCSNKYRRSRRNDDPKYEHGYYMPPKIVTK